MPFWHPLLKPSRATPTQWNLPSMRIDPTFERLRFLLRTPRISPQHDRVTPGIRSHPGSSRARRAQSTPRQMAPPHRDSRFRHRPLSNVAPHPGANRRPRALESTTLESPNTTTPTSTPTPGVRPTAQHRHTRTPNQPTPTSTVSPTLGRRAPGFPTSTTNP